MLTYKSIPHFSWLFTVDIKDAHWVSIVNLQVLSLVRQYYKVYNQHSILTRPPPAMKSDLIDRRIGELENELARLRQRKVAQLREELSRLESELNGVRPAKSSKGWATEVGTTTENAPEISSGRSGGRGKRLSEEDVVERLRRVVAAAGSEGISARAAAQEAGVFYLRAIKAMDGAFVKTGSGKWTRYTV